MHFIAMLLATFLAMLPIFAASAAALPADHAGMLKQNASARGWRANAVSDPAVTGTQDVDESANLPSLVTERAAAVTSSYYRLRAQVIPGPHWGAPHAHFDGTYVQIYHTGAGLDDAVLISNRSEAFPGFLNGTYQQFAIPEAPGQDFPWGMDITTLVEYTGEVSASCSFLGRRLL